MRSSAAQTIAGLTVGLAVSVALTVVVPAPISSSPDAADQRDLVVERVPDARLVTVPGVGLATGGLHPTTQMLYDLNDAFVAVNRLLKDNGEIYWVKGAGAGVPSDPVRPIG